MSAIKHKCKEMWNININATYYDWANMICELVVMNDCNNDDILCFLAVVSYRKLYNMLNMYTFVDLESE